MKLVKHVSIRVKGKRKVKQSASLSYLYTYRFPVDERPRAFERAFASVAVELLEQCAAGAEREVVGAPGGGLHGGEDALEHVAVDAVALDDAQVRR